MSGFVSPSSSSSSSSFRFPNLANVTIDPNMPAAYVVGQVGHPQAKIVRIVHISDTLGEHYSVRENIPMGHILIHSGDFGTSFPFYKHFRKKSDYRRQLHRMDHFFRQLPHPFKIFVPGDRDFPLQFLTSHEIQQHLPSVIYLHDAACTLLGLKFYGTPWNVGRGVSAPFNSSFVQSYSYVKRKWNEIPDDVNVLITHMDPWCSDALYNNVAKRIQPTVHLFSDDEAAQGIIYKDRTLFCNGAMHGKQVTTASWSRSSGSRTASNQSHSSFFSRMGQSSRSSSRRERRYVNLHSGSSASRPMAIVIDVYVVPQDFNYIQLPTYLPPTTSAPPATLPQDESREPGESGKQGVDRPSLSLDDEVIPSSLSTWNWRLPSLLGSRSSFNGKRLSSRIPPLAPLCESSQALQLDTATSPSSYSSISTSPSPEDAAGCSSTSSTSKTWFHKRRSISLVERCPSSSPPASDTRSLSISLATSEHGRCTIS